MRKQLTSILRWRRIMAQLTRPPRHDGGERFSESGARDRVRGGSAVTRAMAAPMLRADPPAPPIAFAAGVERRPRA